VILQAPGVAQESYGQLHVRDEHANLQFRIDDVLIPEGITGFSQEIDTHLVKSVALITGSLPAKFGFRTSGIIDIHTKVGVTLNDGDLSYYRGSNATIFPPMNFDLLYGSGLRSGFANTDELPGYYPFNLGFTHLFHLPATTGFGFLQRHELGVLIASLYSSRKKRANLENIAR
jgi:hypothetical protein